MVRSLAFRPGSDRCAAHRIATRPATIYFNRSVPGRSLRIARLHPLHPERSAISIRTDGKLDLVQTGGGVLNPRARLPGRYGPAARTRKYPAAFAPVSV